MFKTLMFLHIEYDILDYKNTSVKWQNTSDLCIAPDDEPRI